MLLLKDVVPVAFKSAAVKNPSDSAVKVGSGYRNWWSALPFHLLDVVN